MLSFVLSKYGDAAIGKDLSKGVKLELEELFKCYLTMYASKQRVDTTNVSNEMEFCDEFDDAYWNIFNLDKSSCFVRHIPYSPSSESLCFVLCSENQELVLHFVEIPSSISLAKG